MFLTGREIKAQSHANAGIVHFPTSGLTWTWKALGLGPRPFQALMTPLAVKCTKVCQSTTLRLNFNGLYLTKCFHQSLIHSYRIIPHKCGLIKNQLFYRFAV